METIIPTRLRLRLRFGFGFKTNPRLTIWECQPGILVDHGLSLGNLYKHCSIQSGQDYPKWFNPNPLSINSSSLLSPSLGHLLKTFINRGLPKTKCYYIKIEIPNSNMEFLDFYPIQLNYGFPLVASHIIPTD